MSGIAGLRGTGDWSTDERPKNFRDNILFINPNGDAPIFALTGRAKKKTTNDPEFHWWAEGNKIVRLQVNGALAASDTTVTVDSVDPTATTMAANYGTATHLKPGDILLVEPAADNATFDHELVVVESVLSDTSFIVSRGFGGTSAAAIADDRWLLLIGSAYAEGTDAPRAVSRNPTKFSNYTQIFKDTYELTGTADETEVRTGSPWSNDKKRKTFDHARAIEWSMMFGRASESVGENGKPLRTMAGLRAQIPAANVTVFGTAVTANSFTDAIGPAFAFDMGGGDTRVAFMGNAARLEMSKVIQATTGVSVEVRPGFRSWGMMFEEWFTPLGRLLVKTHPLMTMHPLYKKSAFVLDFGSISYVPMRNRDTKTKDDVQTKSEDLRRGFIQTECSIMVDGGGLSNVYLGNISAT